MGGSGPCNMTQHTIVLGGGPIGIRLSTGVVTGDYAVSYVDDDKMTKRARAVGLTTRESTLETAPRIDAQVTTVVVAPERLGSAEDDTPSTERVGVPG